MDQGKIPRGWKGLRTHARSTINVVRYNIQKQDPVLFLKVFLALSILSMTAYLVLNSWYKDIPYTSFSPTSMKIIPYHNYSVHELFQNSTTYSAEDKAEKTLCIGILSVDRRPSPNYLLRTLGSLYAHMDEEDRREVHIIVNNVMANPDDHPDAISVAQYVQVINASSKAKPRTFRKQNEDYANTMLACRDHARYTLILEDDLAATSHWFKKLSIYFTQLDRRQDYLFVKLFDIQKMYNFYGLQWISLYLFSATAGAAVAFMCHVMGKSFRRNTYITAFVGTWICILIAQMISAAGRQHTIWAETPGISTLWSCCTQAHLYPKWVIEPLANYLGDHDAFDEWADMETLKFADDEQLVTLTLRPNLFQHVGSASSVIGFAGGNAGETDRLVLFSSSFIE